MKMLMKYEMRKTWFLKAVLLALTAAAEAVFLVGLFSNNNDVYVTGIGLLIFLAFSGVAVIGLGTVIVLHRDMNTKQSVMLFMTPHSSYAILGAKVLENLLSILLASAFFFALGFLDITLLFAHEKVLDQLWEMLSKFMQSLFNGRVVIDTPVLAAFVWLIAASWFSTVVTACLADVISAALLSGKRWSGLISVLFFILLTWGQNKLASLFYMGMSFDSFIPIALLRGGIMLVFAVAMYVVTAVIMERRLSV